MRQMVAYSHGINMSNMTILNKIAVADKFGKLLSGKVTARQHFAIASGLLADVPAGEVIVFDFAGVDYVSGSWINWMLVPLVTYAADDSNDHYLVLINFPAISLDDLHLIANVEHTPFLVTTGSKLNEVMVVGDLDPAQTVTLLAVQNKGTATGASLADENVKPTAWNNRLRDLNLKRLLRRRKEGREQVYSIVLPEVRFYG